MKSLSVLALAAALCWMSAGAAQAGGRGNGSGPGQGDSRETGDIGAMRGPESSPRNNPEFGDAGFFWTGDVDTAERYRFPEPDPR